MTDPMDAIEPPSPPPSPPQISFDPPLFLQRRTAIHKILKELISGPSPKFTKDQITSLLDIGCGPETTLLRTLVTCDDDLPLERLGGIDVDPDLVRTATDGSWDVERLVSAEDRWRELTVELYNGSFEAVTRDLGRWDVIVSSEVIEHLDPHPLFMFAPIILGDLKPKVFIVTTPNRDFNKAWDLPMTTPPNLEFGDCIVDCDTAGRYWREGVPYPMRHHDHRFEWTRQEFQEWADQAAEAHGYEVTFSGVGTLKNGLVHSSPNMQSAVNRELDADESDESDELDELANRLQEAGFAEDPFVRAQRQWGDCTQIAIFTIKPETKLQTDLHPYRDKDSIQTPYGVRCLNRKIYPAKTDDVYPPPIEESLHCIIKALVQFVPHLVSTHWNQPPNPEAPWERFVRDIDEISELESVFEVSEEELAERRLARRREKREQAREEKLTLKGLDVKDIVAVVGEISLQKVWEASWELRRSWRFHFDDFVEALRSLGECGGEDWQVQNINGELMGEKIVIDAPDCGYDADCSSSFDSIPSFVPDEGSTDNEASELAVEETLSQVDVSSAEADSEGLEDGYSTDSSYEWNSARKIYDTPYHKRIRPLQDRMPIEFTLPLSGKPLQGIEGNDLPTYFGLGAHKTAVLHMDPIKGLEGEDDGKLMLAVKFTRPREFEDAVFEEPWVGEFDDAWAESESQIEESWDMNI